MLAWPGGRVLVAAGLVGVGVGVGVIKAPRNPFTEEINTSSVSPTTRKGLLRLGQVGYIARANPIVGGLLTYATLTFDRQRAQGLDGALQTILAQPFGKFLLTAVALGFVGVRPVCDPPIAVPAHVTQQLTTRKSRLQPIRIIPPPDLAGLDGAGSPTVTATHPR